MIMAYDEGAWHPDSNLIWLWLLPALVAVVSQVRLARGAPRRVADYVVVALPVASLLGLNLYFDYGQSGSYVGDGSMGSGAHFDLFGGVVRTVWECLPTLVLIAFAHWDRLRLQARGGYWSIFAVFVVMEFVFGLFVFMVLADA